MRAGFYWRVYEIVSQVPEGRVVTYAQIARHLGAPNGARVVGWAMRQCPSGIPWHRVVNSQGMLSQGQHRRYIDLQRSLLEAEGVQFTEERIELGIFGWDGI